MIRRGFTDVILAKVRDSAVRYAHKAAKRKPSFANAIKRASEITGIKCIGEYTICHEHLDEMLQQLELFLQSEQKKSRENTACYDFYRHTELHSLRNYLKNEHSKLLACRATNKLQ